MKLENMIIIPYNGNYRFKSLVREYEIELNYDGFNSVKNLLDLYCLNEIRSEEELFLKGIFEGYLSSGEIKYLFHETQYHITSIEILQKCNLSCKHCYLGEKEKSKINLEKFKEIVDSTIVLGGYHIDITGGEPFLDKSLFQKLEYSRENNLKTTLTTNATLINLDIVKRLKELNLSSITITLNGNKIQHEEIYGLGNYDKTIRALESLSNEGLDIIINTMLYDGNYEQRLTFEEEIKKRFNIVKVNLTPIKAIGAAIKNPAIILSEIKKVGKLSNQCTQNPKNGLTCSAGKAQTFIKSNGDVLACPELLDFKIGNIYEKRLEDIIWK